ncbi:MAG: homoserine dehydrogenase [Chloroflexi bacterium]|jgi:homoserine dehydrogenase|nr:homoserine dehydrogenase [Chloroflexota bacterium]MBT3671240.1 homoserine dehydrogenase [Chloroflexota bacterium]MBT4004368.1 homoserine dehydrogenase [Chloroflexota bacterium]MBT4304301.1 homoserine dehydrogenase [Chloroflexota bacterium]MBT4534320.1 homoserine dehydrogenase [Chloroflexota bacterium]
MAEYKLTLLGFGNVGKALARLLKRKENELNKELDIQYRIVAVATGSHGRAINPEGLNIDELLSTLEKGDSLDTLSTISAPSDNLAFIQASGADVLFENTPVSYEDGQPAIDHIKAALSENMHVATANKGPVVHGYRELSDLALSRDKKFFFESTVMDGAPVFSVFRVLPAANIQSISGVLNSTTNLILSQMEEGNSFGDAVAYAQSIGIAETDPSGDVDGWDAAIKISALIAVLMNTPYTPEMVEREGIRNITPGKIAAAKAAGKRWKLVCTARREGNKISAKVSPQMVDPRNPMFTVDGTTSIVQVETDVLGKLSLIEDDPGPHTTAYGLLADFINSVQE